MSQVRGREKVSHMDVKGAKAMFENSARRQREPSPAPTGFGGHSTNKRSISSFKEKFEQFTAPRQDNSLPLRKALSVENVTAKEEGSSQRRPRSSSSGRAEKNWLSAKTKIYEQLTSDSKSNTQTASESDSAVTSSSQKLPAVATKVEKKLPAVAAKPQAKAATKGKTDSKRDDKDTTKKEIFSTALFGKNEAKNGKAEDKSSQNRKASVKDIKSNFTASTKSSDQQKPSQSVSSLKNKASLFEKLTSEKKEQPSTTKTAASNTISLANKFKPAEPAKKPEAKEPDRVTTEHITKVVTDSKSTPIEKKQLDQVNHKVVVIAHTDKEEKENNNNHKPNTVAEIKDHVSAKTFMEDLINAIDNEQHVPMKQLINLFEKMKEDNSTMRDSLEQLRQQLDKSDIEDLNKTLQGKLDETANKLETTQTEMKELELYKQALEESDERCEELEELNRQYFQEIEYLKLEMNEMRDQFHDDEVHETIILQQRLDDMARSLRIIHFRLKKADARLQETEREKESLLEEIRLLQGGTFTDEEIKRMQALEGDLQSAKEVSIQLHTQLEKSEERQEKLEIEAARLRDELKAANMENDRLRNNIQHLREQMSNESMACSTDSNSLCPTTATLVRQGSSTDVETLKSNLESAIERENDLKEQLKYAEEEARTLRKSLRDIENENEALTKQLKRLSQIAHAKSRSPSADSVTSESIQTQVIQLENVELRSSNDKLHHEIESLQDQVKSLQQKLELMEHEQNDGPLCHSKNSLYYETKFELMSKEIEDLRWQLHEKGLERRRLRDDSSDSQSKQADIRCIMDDERHDATKQLEGVRKEAEILRERLHKLENNNRRLEDGMVPVPSDESASGASLEKANEILTNKVSSLEKTNADLLKRLERQQESSEQSSRLIGLEKERSRLQTELNQLRQANPDFAALVSGLHQSEEKFEAYEAEIRSLRSDSLKMERTLQDDINSLTMKNSILSSLLEAINHHEGTESIAAPLLRSSGSNSSSSFSSKMDSSINSEPTGSGGAGLTTIDSDTEAFISRHISRLPSDIQKQFRDKLVTLENQLQEERERAMTAENLLQQVKLHLKSCVLSSPIIKILQPRKPFKYPNPPPSLIIKPSACNSPSHAHLGTKANRLDTQTLTNAISTPERIKIGQSLASEMYLGNFPTLFQKTDSQDTVASDDEVLTISIQSQSTSKCYTDTSKKQQKNPLPESPLVIKRSVDSQNGYSVMSASLDSADLQTMLSTNTENGITTATAPDHNDEKRIDTTELEVDGRKITKGKTIPTLTVSESAPLLNGHCNGTTTLNSSSITSTIKKEKEKMKMKMKKSSLRSNFFENYSSLISRGFRAKKRVSFALPALERDVSDMSISSHLSAVGDCVVVDDEEDRIHE